MKYTPLVSNEEKLNILKKVFGKEEINRRLITWDNFSAMVAISDEDEIYDELTKQDKKGYADRFYFSPGDLSLDFHLDCVIFYDFDVHISDYNPYDNKTPYGPAVKPSLEKQKIRENWEEKLRGAYLDFMSNKFGEKYTNQLAKYDRTKEDEDELSM